MYKNYAYLKLKMLCFSVVVALCPELAQSRTTDMALLAKTTVQRRQETVSGKVVDEHGIPLPGATVKVAGAKSVVVTGVDGSFKINAARGEDS